MILETNCRTNVLPTVIMWMVFFDVDDGLIFLVDKIRWYMYHAYVRVLLISKRRIMCLIMIVLPWTWMF